MTFADHRLDDAGDRGGGEGVRQDGDNGSALRSRRDPRFDAGDGAGHDARIAEAAGDLAGCDAFVLAQFSMARARDAVAEVAACPVFSAPVAAVTKLERLFATGADA